MTDSGNGQSSTLLTIAQNVVSAINSLKSALTPTSSGLTVGGTSQQLQYNNAGALGGFTAGGDATITPSTGAVALASVITAGGPTGDATHVAQVTYDAKGRLTAVSSVAITFPTSAGSLVSVVDYSGSQTITIPATATKARIRMWGGTGGSGGTTIAGASGGTGAAGYVETYLTGLTPGNTLVYTQGALGIAGTSAPGAGGNGTASTLASGTQTISTLTANGSNGSTGVTSASSAGTAGGTASGGNILNLTGKAGQDGYTTGSTAGIGGAGGGLVISYGANGVSAVAATAGNAGQTGGLVIEWFS